MIRKSAVGLVFLSVILCWPVMAGAAEKPALCSIAGSVAPAPGVGYTPQSGTFNLTGTLDCSSDAPSHGTMTGTGTGTIGCLGGSSTALLTVAWDGGQTSTMKVQFGDVTYGTGGYGTVDDGAFKSSQVMLGWGREAAMSEMRCISGGVKSYEFAGGVAIG
jgi:hypothetical protein